MCWSFFRSHRGGAKVTNQIESISISGSMIRLRGNTLSLPLSLTIIVYDASQVPVLRVAGFVKRLCTVSLQSQANSALAFLAYVKTFLQVNTPAYPTPDYFEHQALRLLVWTSLSTLLIFQLSEHSVWMAIHFFVNFDIFKTLYLSQK